MKSFGSLGEDAHGQSNEEMSRLSYELEMIYGTITAPLNFWNYSSSYSVSNRLAGYIAVMSMYSL
jgi:hypothetical protein